MGIKVEIITDNFAKDLDRIIVIGQAELEGDFVRVPAEVSGGLDVSNTSFADVDGPGQLDAGLHILVDEHVDFGS